MDEEDDDAEPMQDDDEDEAPEQSMHRGSLRGSAVEAKNLPDLNDHHVRALQRVILHDTPPRPILRCCCHHHRHQVAVVCNEVRGAFLVTRQQVVCNCTPCLRLPLRQRTFTPCQFERHAGSKAKKWKISIKLDADAAESLGLDHGDQPVTIGQYYDRRGIEVKPLYKKGGGNNGGDLGVFDDPSSTTCSGGSPADMVPSRCALWLVVGHWSLVVAGRPPRFQWVFWPLSIYSVIE